MLKLILYFLASGIAAAVNFGSRFIYDIYMDFWLSVVLAYFTGMIVNYAISRKYVFDSYSGATFKNTLLKFAFVAFIGFGITTIVSVGALELIHSSIKIHDDLAKAIAHCLGIGTAFFASFFGHKFLTFRSTGVSKILRRFNK